MTLSLSETKTLAFCGTQETQNENPTANFNKKAPCSGSKRFWYADKIFVKAEKVLEVLKTVETSQFQRHFQKI